MSKGFSSAGCGPRICAGRGTVAAGPPSGLRAGTASGLCRGAAGGPVRRRPAVGGPGRPAGRFRSRNKGVTRRARRRVTGQSAHTRPTLLGENDCKVLAEIVLEMPPL